MSRQGKLIVVEGIDGSGKRTQWRRLVRYLRQTGRRVIGVDFPRYRQSVWGKLVKELLTGKQGNFQAVTPYLSTLPYVLDQVEWIDRVGRKALQEGKWIVANRYVTSNVHQIHKLTGQEREKFGKWFWRMVYEELGLPRPAAVLVLDVPPALAGKLMGGKKRDKAERDDEYQMSAYKGYLAMCREDKTWIRVDCRDRKGKLLTKAEISGRIKQIFHEKFKTV